MRRLTRIEYDNTVRDLLGDTTLPAEGFVADDDVAGFSGNSITAVGVTQVRHYKEAAEKLAQGWMTRNPSVPCPGAAAGTRACVEKFVDDFGRRAFRRPLAELPGARDQLLAVFDKAAAAGGAAGFSAGVKLMMASALQSPYFLYHLELGPGTAAADEVRTLTGHELASRLSYFLWKSMPDAPLMAAADLGGDAVLGQIGRMLKDAKAKDGLREFMSHWLELETPEQSITALDKETAVFPQWNENLRAAMQKESELFFDFVVRSGDAKMATLMGGRETFVNAALAPIYGVDLTRDAVTLGPLASATLPAGWKAVSLDPAKRAGILTQASVMAMHAAGH
jgi:hypothetical protein